MMERADLGQKLYSRMRLWEFPDQYVIEPTDGNCRSALAIDRVDGSMKLIDEIPECKSLRVPKLRTIYGVVGMLKLLLGSYLVVITERQCVGSYMGHSVFKVSSLKVLPCDNSLKQYSPEQKKAEFELSGLLNVAEKTHGLYFSYETNLTLSTQQLHILGGDTKMVPLWRQAEPRFLWNNYLLEALIENKLDPYLLPVIQGSFQTFQAAIGKVIVDITLIARRSNRRNGTRLWRRGADADGYVANFVESEQIVQFNGYTASFVQGKHYHDMGSCYHHIVVPFLKIRGSIPLLWEQIVDLTYKPKFEMIALEEAPRALERHFVDIRKKYGAVVAIDLINGHGAEGHLSEKFSSSMQDIASDDVRYLHFDFHGICGHVHFERLSILYDKIEDFLAKNGYFLLNEKNEKMSEQLGIVRTNCIDCLDRTNVTQSMIGRKVMETQFRRLGIFGAEESICSHPNLDESFKILWANHGDDISIQYSGTPALKGDFVRFGKRTIQGMINDGRNALARYYFNNFSDGTRQDAIDLVQGHYIISRSRDMSPSSRKDNLEAVSSFPAALAVVVVGIFFATASLSRVTYDFRNIFYALMWAGLSGGVLAYMKANGRMFCNRPSLQKPHT